MSASIFVQKSNKKTLKNNSRKLQTTPRWGAE
jgi:hypothetical protein